MRPLEPAGSGGEANHGLAAALFTALAGLAALEKGGRIFAVLRVEARENSNNSR